MRKKVTHFRLPISGPVTMRLQKDLCTGSISRDLVDFPSELCSRSMFAEAARLAPPDKDAVLFLVYVISLFMMAYLLHDVVLVGVSVWCLV